MSSLIFIATLVLFLIYLISRSWINSLEGFVDDRSYKTARVIMILQLVFVLGLEVMVLITAFMRPGPLAATGPSSYGGLLGGFFAAFLIIKDYVRVADAHEAYIIDQKLREIESRPGEAEKRAFRRRENTECDPDTEWRCPRCKSVNSNYVGTCGCGYCRLNNEEE